MSDNNSEKNHISVNEFKACVKLWISVNEELEKLKYETSIRKKKISSLSDTIVSFMKTHDKSACDLGDAGVLELKQKKTKQALKKDQVCKLLEDFIKDSKKCEEISQFLFDNKQIKESFTLKKVNPQ